MLLLMRKSGIIFPANCRPVSGSKTTGVAPLEFFDCEKFPRRSSAVGTVTVTGSVGVIVCGFSYEKKKNDLFETKPRPPSPKVGSGKGPPMLNPGTLCLYSGRTSPALLLKKLLS